MTSKIIIRMKNLLDRKKAFTLFVWAPENRIYLKSITTFPNEMVTAWEIASPKERLELERAVGFKISEWRKWLEQRRERSTPRKTAMK
jgi:hypothetical protein